MKVMRYVSVKPICLCLLLIFTVLGDNVKLHYGGKCKASIHTQ